MPYSSLMKVSIHATIGSGLLTQMSLCITGSPEAKRETPLNPLEASLAMSSQLALLEVQLIRAAESRKGRWLAAATKLSCSSTPMKKGLAPMASAIVLISDTAFWLAFMPGTMQ